ncbi:tyrosine-type recombinase/integrase [Ancylobacter terrae]|uniref:tyrosine-type recombinase/integrase n=1 Tax=Ancylobacter sp. sgz301288 TaxID=3342077 RepID=UPI00385FD10D
MATKLTKRAVDGLEPREKAYVAYDADLKGFGVRVLSTGAKSWVVEYRPGAGGRSVAKRRITIGATTMLTPDQARAKAKDLLAQARLGADPAGVRAAERRAVSLKEVAAAFLKEHVEAKRKPGTAAYYRDIIDRLIVPELGSRKAEAVTTPEVAKFHGRLRDTPVQANRMLAVLGSLYGWAAKNNLVPAGANPAADVERYRENGRERFLTPEEMGRLGEAIREAETTGIPWQIDPSNPKAKHVPKAQQRTIIDQHAAAALRLLLLTGCRLREILHLRWSEVDFERGLLLLPDSKTGRKAVVLNAPAVTLLSSLPRVGAFVIAGASAGTKEERPRSDLKRPWSAVSRRAGLSGVRLHDLRHTHASIGAGAGLGLPIIGKLLGHTQAATTQRYAHLDNDPLRRASDQIGSAIVAAMDGTSPKPKRRPPLSTRKLPKS